MHISTSSLTSNNSLQTPSFYTQRCKVGTCQFMQLLGPVKNTKILYARKDSTQAFCAQHCSSVASKCAVGQVACTDNGGYIKAVLFNKVLLIVGFQSANYHKRHTLCHFYDILKTLPLPEMANDSVSRESALNIAGTITIIGSSEAKTTTFKLSLMSMQTTLMDEEILQRAWQICQCTCLLCRGTGF